MTAYYNEIDPYAAEWLRNLIAAGHIAPGVVDERSIQDVRPDELMGFTQCHFFAGIGVWSLALRRAGWPDHRPVWTGSCPCQPFSQAGQEAGFDDERHLWPDFHWLIKECRPTAVLGEQVASKTAEPWVDLVQADLEALGYAFGAVPFPSAGVGAPHIRDRNFWLGLAAGAGPQGKPDGRNSRPRRQGRAAERAGAHGRLADLHRDGRGEAGQRLAAQELHGAVGDGTAGGMGHTDSEHAGRNPGPGSGQKEEPEVRPVGDVPGAPGATDGLADADVQRQRTADDAARTRDFSRSVENSGPGPTNGFWRAADWLLCRDGKWRPVEPGTSPLADGPASRVGSVQPGLRRLYGRNRTGRLKGYGNAINAEAATQFIATVMEVTGAA